MDGLIGKIRVVPRQRDVLSRVLLEGLRRMPSCLSYVLAYYDLAGQAGE